MTSSAALQRALMMENYPTNTTSGGGNYTSETLTFSGGLITDAVREAGLEGDGLTPPAGVGVWPAATNIALRSNALNTAPWAKTNLTVTENGATDPYGNQTANLITVSAPNPVLSQDITVVASTTYTFSFWAQRGTRTSAAYRVFDLSNGADIVAVTSYYSSINASTMTRVTVTFTTPLGCTLIRVYPLTEPAGSTGTMSIWGVQLETGSIATPYIETDGGTATRAAGRVQQPDTDDLMTEAQGWVYGATRFGIANTALSTGIAVLWQWLDDTNNFLRVSYDWQNNRVSFIRRAAGVQTESTVAATFAAQGLLTWGADWTATEIAAIANGTRATPSADTNIPTLTATIGDIGSNAGSDSFLFGNDRSFETGSGVFTDADAAALNAFGDTPPTWAQIKGALPATAALTSLWPAVTNAYQKVAS